MSLIEELLDAANRSAMDQAMPAIQRKLRIGIYVSIMLAITVLATAIAVGWPIGIIIISVIVSVPVGILITFLVLPAPDTYSPGEILGGYRGFLFVTASWLGGASSSAFLLVQLALANVPVGFIMLVASLVLVVAYIFVTPPDLSYRPRPSEPPRPPRPSEPPRPQRSHAECSSAGLSQMVNVPVGRVLFATLTFSVLIMGALFLIASPRVDDADKNAAVAMLGTFVGVGLEYIGIVAVLLAIAVCVYVVFGPGGNGVIGNEILYTLLGTGMDGFFPWLRSKAAGASLVIALVAVPMCLYVIFVSDLKGIYEKFAMFAVTTNIVILFRHFRNFARS